MSTPRGEESASPQPPRRACFDLLDTFFFLRKFPNTFSCCICRLCARYGLGRRGILRRFAPVFFLYPPYYNRSPISKAATVCLRIMPVCAYFLESASPQMLGSLNENRCISLSRYVASVVVYVRSFVCNLPTPFPLHVEVAFRCFRNYRSSHV